MAESWAARLGRAVGGAVKVVRPKQTTVPSAAAGGALAPAARRALEAPHGVNQTPYEYGRRAGPPADKQPG